MRRPLTKSQVVSSFYKKLILFPEIFKRTYPYSIFAQLKYPLNDHLA